MRDILSFSLFVEILEDLQLSSWAFSKLAESNLRKRAKMNRFVISCCVRYRLHPDESQFINKKKHFVTLEAASKRVKDVICLSKYLPCHSLEGSEEPFEAVLFIALEHPKESAHQYYQKSHIFSKTI